MIFHFTCSCGNLLEVEASSELMAEKGIERSGWAVSVNWKDAKPVPYYFCSRCLESANAQS